MIPATDGYKTAARAPIIKPIARVQLDPPGVTVGPTIVPVTSAHISKDSGRYPRASLDLEIPPDDTMSQIQATPIEGLMPYGTTVTLQVAYVTNAASQEQTHWLTVFTGDVMASDVAHPGGAWKLKCDDVSARAAVFKHREGPELPLDNGAPPLTMIRYADAVRAALDAAGLDALQLRPGGTMTARTVDANQDTAGKTAWAVIEAVGDATGNEAYGTHDGAIALRANPSQTFSVAPGTAPDERFGLDGMASYSVAFNRRFNTAKVSVKCLPSEIEAQNGNTLWDGTNGGWTRDGHELPNGVKLWGNPAGEGKAATDSDHIIPVTARKTYNVLATVNSATARHKIQIGMRWTKGHGGTLTDIDGVTWSSEVKTKVGKDRQLKASGKAPKGATGLRLYIRIAKKSGPTTDRHTINAITVHDTEDKPEPRWVIGTAVDNAPKVGPADSGEMTLTSTVERGYAWWLDPDSFSGEADALAAAMLTRASGYARQISAEVPLRPWLEPGDIVEITGATGTKETHILESLEWDILPTPSHIMQIKTRNPLPGNGL
jgi:hypothetical protein